MTQVKWTETVFERGEQTGRSRWTAILGVIHRAPANADVLRRNPLGIYIDAIDWSREFEPASMPPPPISGSAAPTPDADIPAPVTAAIPTPESRP